MCSLCSLKRCADCIRQELGHNIASYFTTLTGLRLHLLSWTGLERWCPEGSLHSTAAEPERCAACVGQNWTDAGRAKTTRGVFAGACGRKNCRLDLRSEEGCVLTLVIQGPIPRGADHGRTRGKSPLRTKELTDGEAASGPSPPTQTHGSMAFGDAVKLLEIVANGLESRLEAEELRQALDNARREREAILKSDVELRHSLRKRLPELSGEPMVPGEVPRPAQLVDQVRHYVLQHYHRPTLGLADAAASVSRSPSYISTVFARETGIPFHVYVQELRLAKARRLLQDPRLTVAEIAQASGYASACWFRHVFRQHVGMSPSQWRQASS